MVNRITKIGLTLVVVCCVAYPYIFSADKSGSIETVFEAGILGTLIIATIFLTGVFFYCRALQNCLQLIKPENRTATPKSVWYMFLIPYNIIEDFFIVINVSKSIENEARQNPRLASLQDNGMVVGIGWSIAQILSLIPNWGGQLAGLAGLILWIVHWIFILRVNRLLLQ